MSRATHTILKHSSTHQTALGKRNLGAVTTGIWPKDKPCTNPKGNDSKGAVHLPYVSSSNRWDGRKLIRIQMWSSVYQKKSLSQKTQKEDEDTKMQKPTCFCRQKSYQVQISKIFIGPFFVTFKRIFMSVVKKNIQKVI